MIKGQKIEDVEKLENVVGDVENKSEQRKQDLCIPEQMFEADPQDKLERASTDCEC